MELGLTSFAETIPDPRSGETVGHGERLRQVLEDGGHGAEDRDPVGLGDGHQKIAYFGRQLPLSYFFETQERHGGKSKFSQIAA